MTGGKSYLETKIPSINQNGIDSEGNIIKSDTTSKVQATKKKRASKSQDALDKQVVKKNRAQVVNQLNEAMYEISPTDNVVQQKSTSILMTDNSEGTKTVDEDVLMEPGMDAEPQADNINLDTSPNQLNQLRLVQKLTNLFMNAKSNYIYILFIAFFVLKVMIYY